MTPYVYPEDFGAVADGKTDDWAAIHNAIIAAAGNQSVRFSGSYGIGQAITVGPGTSIAAGAGASLNAVGPAPSAFKFISGDRFHRLPSLSGFAGSAIIVAAGVLNLKCHKVASCGAAVELQGGAINNSIDIHWTAATGSVLKVSNPTASAGSVIQGNTVTGNFAVGCVKGLDYDGSANCDSNTFRLGSWDSSAQDSTGKWNPIPGAIIWGNTGAGPSALCSTWDLSVTNWIGGLAAAPSGYIAKGGFQFCRFGVGNFATFPGNWDAIAITTGGGNQFVASSSTGYANSFVANWRVQSNDRAACGPAAYQNTRRFNGKTAFHAAGTLFQTFAYTPFYDGNSFGFRVQPVVNPGFALVSIVDNSASVKGEVIITWKATNDIPLYSEFDFQLTAGVP